MMTGGRFTVFGHRGFIGSAVATALEAAGHDVVRPGRDARPDTLGDMGDAIYCIGLTADFRTRPYDTMEAHVGLPARILRDGRYRSFLYLSSTRVYGPTHLTSEETRLSVDPADPSDLYNLSKLSGESLCLTHPNPAVRAARLSNIYGPGMFADTGPASNFLASVLGDAVRSGSVRLATSPSSEKDYLHVDDAVRALLLIAQDGDRRLYNVASGENVSHSRILARLTEVTGCVWSAAPGMPETAYPRIPTQALAGLFRATGSEWAPVRLVDELPSLVAEARRALNIKQGAVA